VVIALAICDGTIGLNYILLPYVNVPIGEIYLSLLAKAKLLDVRMSSNVFELPHTPHIAATARR
jgi:hypothetical protein